MIVIPAVDIKDGNCVRLVRGRADRSTVYSDNPVSAAIHWEKMGAKRLHVVDLDGAFSGTMKNQKAIVEIIQKLNIPVQVGGGIRDIETVRSLINAGVSHVILGTSAVNNTEFVKEAINCWRDKIIVGIDSVKGNVATEGWKDITEMSAVELAKDMQQFGVKEIIVTDIKKDGALRGPNLKWIRKIASAVTISVIASGGVSKIEDIKKIVKLKLTNIKGIIVGKALYDSNFELSEAVAAAEHMEE